MTDSAMPGLQCVRCGYELRGLSLRGLCPECAYSIGSSYQEMLQRADAGRLRSGLAVLIGAASASTLAAVTAIPFEPPFWSACLCSGCGFALAHLICLLFAAVQLSHQTREEMTNSAPEGATLRRFGALITVVPAAIAWTVAAGSGPTMFGSTGAAQFLLAAALTLRSLLLIPFAIRLGEIARWTHAPVSVKRSTAGSVAATLVNAAVNGVLVYFVLERPSARGLVEFALVLDIVCVACLAVAALRLRRSLGDAAVEPAPLWAEPEPQLNNLVLRFVLVAAAWSIVIVGIGYLLTSSRNIGLGLAMIVAVAVHCQARTALAPKWPYMRRVLYACGFTALAVMPLAAQVRLEVAWIVVLAWLSRIAFPGEPLAIVWASKPGTAVPRVRERSVVLAMFVRGLWCATAVLVVFASRNARLLDPALALGSIAACLDLALHVCAIVIASRMERDERGSRSD